MSWSVVKGSTVLRITGEAFASNLCPDKADFCELGAGYCSASSNFLADISVNRYIYEEASVAIYMYYEIRVCSPKSCLKACRLIEMYKGLYSIGT